VDRTIEPNLDPLQGYPLLSAGQVGERDQVGLCRPLDVTRARGHSRRCRTTATSAAYSNAWLTRYSSAKIAATLAKLP